MQNQQWTVYSYISSLLATLSGWAINDWLSLFGFFALVFTTASSYYFKRKDLAIKNELLQLRKDELRQEIMQEMDEEHNG